MQRTDIITTIGREYLTSNMENDEFNFQRALLDIGLNTGGFLVAEARRQYMSAAGISCTKEITAEDEWLCEAYMKTDYSKLTQKEFENTVRDYLAYKVKVGRVQV